MILTCMDFGPINKTIEYYYELFKDSKHFKNYLKDFNTRARRFLGNSPNSAHRDEQKFMEDYNRILKIAEDSQSFTKKARVLGDEIKVRSNEQVAGINEILQRVHHKYNYIKTRLDYAKKKEPQK